VWLLYAGDGYESSWVLGVYSTETAAKAVVAEHFSDFQPWPERGMDHVRPSWMNDDETWQERERRIDAEISEPEIRQGANYVDWHEYQVND
jgi:hypothetical protein